MSDRQHPLHSIKFITDCLNSTGQYPGNRRTGRSTAIALRTIAKAIDNPGCELLIRDHVDSTQCHRELAHTINQVIFNLGLEKLAVSDTKCTIKFG